MADLLLAFDDEADTAQRAAQAGGLAFATINRHRFPDGELKLRLPTHLPERVVLWRGLQAPNEKLVELLLAARTARALGARHLTLVAPYLAYMRQDKRFQPGEAVTSRSYARLLSASLDFLVTVDPHLHRIHSLGEVYTLRTLVVPAAPLLARWLRSHVDAPWLIGPDQESEQWVAEVARLAGAPWTVLAKTRRGDREVGVRLVSRERWPGRTPVLLDDIISTGHTMLAATRLLNKAGLGAPICMGVHALFDAEAQRQLLDAGVTRVLTCDTITHPSNAIRMAPLLARAVRQLSAGSKDAKK